MPYLIALLLTLCCAISQAATITGKVVAVADGDTITVLDANKVQHKIRLGGIDAPEKAQPFGQTSKQSLSDLVHGKTVMVDTDKTDRYGREVGKVLVDGVDANLEQVRRGLAWHYKAYQLLRPDLIPARDPKLPKVEYGVAFRGNCGGASAWQCSGWWRQRHKHKRRQG